MIVTGKKRRKGAEQIAALLAQAEKMRIALQEIVDEHELWAQIMTDYGEHHAASRIRLLAREAAKTLRRADP